MQHKPRIIYHADGHPWETHIPIKPKREDCFDFVDNLTAAGVDAMSLMVFVGGQVVWRTGLATPRFTKHPLAEPGRLHLERLWAQDVEPIEAYASRCHEKGMRFLAKFRMNDRHSNGRPPGYHHNMHMGQFIQDHQDWWLTDFPGGLDFTHQGVRDWMFELTREVTTRFDVDGVVFNFMRYPYVFERAESRRKQPILTQFMRRVRRMLDEEAQVKGRKLEFCVIVAPTVAESQDFGLDVPAWIEEEIVDSICPCHFDNSLFNDSYAEFARLAERTEVGIFPAVHPGISPYLYYGKVMTPAAYRAAARNIYADGADGISTFNFMCHWSEMCSLWGAGPQTMADAYPGALNVLKELRSADGLEQGGRHYIYWRGRDLSEYTGFRDRHAVPTLARQEGASVQWSLRCAEEFGPACNALIRLNAVNLLPEDEIEISVNGETIPAAGTTRDFHEAGRTGLGKGMPLPPYTEISFVPASPPFRSPDNTLAIGLVRAAPGGSGEIGVPEIEIGVAAGGRQPADVCALLWPTPHSAALPVAAGYHPAIMEICSELTVNEAIDSGYIGTERLADGTEKSYIGAQSFSLRSEAQVSRIEICIYRIPEIQEPLRAELRADQDGVPGPKPVAPHAVSVLDPWESPGGLNKLLQGYYRFAFERPVQLQAGEFWLVLTLDASRQPDSSLRNGDPAAPSCYTPILGTSAVRHYAPGRYMTWDGEEWRQEEKDGRPLSSFFGVFTEPQ